MRGISIRGRMSPGGYGGVYSARSMRFSGTPTVSRISGS